MPQHTWYAIFVYLMLRLEMLFSKSLFQNIFKVVYHLIGIEDFNVSEETVTAFSSSLSINIIVSISIYKTHFQ